MERPPRGTDEYEDAYFVWKWKQRASKTVFGIVFAAVISLLNFGLDPFRSDDEPCRYVKIDMGVYDYVCREPAS
jgi:hypothetical protein